MYKIIRLNKEALRKLIVPALIYGIAWKLAVFSNVTGFIFLIIAGFIYGLTLMLRNYFLETIKGILIFMVLGSISAIPVIGPVIAALVTLYIAFKQLKQILDNFLLIAAGFMLYFLLFYSPSLFQAWYMEQWETEANGWLDFFTGFALYGLIVWALTAIGYEIKNIFIFTLGLPGFIFIFYISGKNSPFN